MSVHTDRRQQLIDQAKQTEEAVHGIADGWPDDAIRQRAERVLAYARTVIEASDEELISANMANQLGSVFTQFVNNAPQTVVSNADGWTDAVLDTTATLPASRPHEVAEAVRESVAKVKRSATNHIHHIDGEHGSLVEKLSTLGDEIDVMRTELTTTVEQQRQQIDSEIAAARAPFDQEIEQARQQLSSEQSSLSTLRTKQSSDYETAEERRNTLAKEQRDEATAEAETQQQSTKSDLDEFLASSQTQIQERVADIERMQEDVRKMVDAVSMAATTEGYGKEAKDQGKAANTWRWITVGSALLAAVVAFLAVNTDEIDLEVLLGKLALSLILGGIAAYAARQSADHRQRERTSRDLQLELAVFGPFIERLDPDRQQQERVEMTRKTFGHVRPVSQTTQETPVGAEASPASGQAPGLTAEVRQWMTTVLRNGSQQQ